MYWGDTGHLNYYFLIYFGKKNIVIFRVDRRKQSKKNAVFIVSGIWSV